MKASALTGSLPTARPPCYGVTCRLRGQAPGLSAFLAMVRILRVLRVFRVFRLGRRLHNELQTRVLMLAFTLLAIIIVLAGLFYEIETRFGVRQQWREQLLVAHMCAIVLPASCFPLH